MQSNIKVFKKIIRESPKKIRSKKLEQKDQKKFKKTWL